MTKQYCLKCKNKKSNKVSIYGETPIHLKYACLKNHTIKNPTMINNCDDFEEVE